MSLPAVVLLASALSADPCAPPDRAALAAEFARAVRLGQGLGADQVEILPETFQLRVQRDCLVNLHNFAAEFCAAPPRERNEVLARLARTSACASVADFPSSYAAARPRLRPVLRSRAFVESGRMALGKKGELAGEPIGDHLVLTLVVDTPEAMHYVAAFRLAEWKVPWATARADALANLRALESAPFVPLSPGCWSGPGGDDVYAASRLLLGDEIRKLAGGDAVATIPSQTSVFVCHAGDAAALAKLAEATEEALDRPRPVSAMPIRIPASGRLEPFVPVAGDPAHRPLRKLRLIELAQVYGQDKQRLEAENQAAGRDVFVGSFMAMKSPDGDYLSVAVLTVGVHTLLPEADAVAFVDPGGGGVFASAPFPAALRALGRAAVRLPGYPPRWEVKELPPVSELRKLGRVAGL